MHEKQFEQHVPILYEAYASRVRYRLLPAVC
jgi:hypothetical protein